MARRGTFGRLPRAAPSLASTILSIALQEQARRDSNIVDAWKNGGTFEGKRVTDDMVLAYWRERMKGLDKSDPEYDTMKNQYEQFDYSINEQKMYTAYKQGKVSDGAMANFYLTWAKKIPKDSQFYRQLQQDAAQYMQHAAASGRASAARGKADAYNAYQAGIVKNYTGLGDAMTALMTQIARDNNIIGADQDLNDFMLAGQNDPGRMVDILNAINNDLKRNPGHYGAAVAYIKQYDPDFNGQFTLGYYASALANATKGWNLLHDRALADGYMDNAKAAAKNAAATAGLASTTASWPVATSYSTYRDAFDKVWKDPNATALDKAQAAETFANQVESLSNAKGLDTAQANRLRNDAAALRGDPRAANQPSFYENYLGSQKLTMGTTTQSGATQGENAKFQAEMQNISIGQQNMMMNPGAYIYAPSKKDALGNDVFDPTGQGPVNIVSRASVDQSPGGTAIIPVPTITGGAVMQAVPRNDIIVDDPNNPSATGTTIGSAITYHIGGREVTLYGTVRNGSMVWSAVSPFSGNVNEIHRPDGSIHIQQGRTVVDDKAVAAQFDSEYGTDISSWWSNGTPSSGTSKSFIDPNNKDTTITVTWKNGQLLYGSKTTTGTAKGGDLTSTTVGATPLTPYQPQTTAQMEGNIFDPSRLAAGLDPTIDFRLPSMAALAESRDSGTAIINAWNTAEFQTQLAHEEVMYANGDPLKFNQIVAENQRIAEHMAEVGASSQSSLWANDIRHNPGDKLLQPSLNAAQTGGEKLGPPAPAYVKFGKTLNLPNIDAMRLAGGRDEWQADRLAQANLLAFTGEGGARMMSQPLTAPPKPTATTTSLKPPTTTAPPTTPKAPPPPPPTPVPTPTSGEGSAITAKPLTPTTPPPPTIRPPGTGPLQY